MNVIQSYLRSRPECTNCRRSKCKSSEAVRNRGQHHRRNDETGKFKERPSPIKYIPRYAFVDPDRRTEDAPVRVRFLLDSSYRHIRLYKCRLTLPLKLQRSRTSVG